MVSDSGSEEETYSIMFSSLKHPARRKILRMLSEDSITFSKCWKSSNSQFSPNVPLGKLGRTCSKGESGKYKLSSFGKASVSMMKGAEEVPNGKSNHFSTLPVKWKSILAALTIAIVLVVA